MDNSDRIRVVFHGAVVLLVGLLCGQPTMLEEEPVRFWHTAHESLIMIGMLLFAVAGIGPMLRLPKREAKGLIWSLLATGYGLPTGLVIQAVTSEHAFGPSSSPILMFAFVANLTGMAGSVVAAALIIMGAHAAAAHPPTLGHP